MCHDTAGSPQRALVWIAVMGPQCLRRQNGAFWEPGGKASVLRDLRRVLVPQGAMSFRLHDFEAVSLWSPGWPGTR